MQFEKILFTPEIRRCLKLQRRFSSSWNSTSLLFAETSPQLGRVLDTPFRNVIIGDADILRRYVQIMDELDTDAFNYKKDLSNLKSLFQQLIEEDSLQSGLENQITHFLRYTSNGNKVTYSLCWRREIRSAFPISTLRLEIYLNYRHHL